MIPSFYSAIGVIGATILIYSNIPQLLLFIKQKHAQGISVPATWIGLIGLLLRFIYLAHCNNGNLIVLGPYAFYFLSVMITLYYCYFPKKEDK